MTSASPAPVGPEQSIPSAKLKPARASGWALGWFWLLPLAAIGVVLFLGVQAWRSRGFEVGLHFLDGHGLRPGDAVKYLGINVGVVRSVVLNPAGSGIHVRLELNHEARGLARTGSKFWIVRPQLDWSGLRGPETLIGANYVTVQPGDPDSPPRFEFDGLEDPPILEKRDPKGLEIVLQANRVGGLRPGVPVLYRQIRVGSVVSVGLASDASAVEARVYIRPTYVNLVRDTNVTKFWNVSGVRMQGSLTGLSVQLDSAESLFAGGVAFATQNASVPRAKTDQRFPLEDAPKKEWLEWQASIPLQDPRLPPGATVPRPLRAKLSWGKKGVFANSKMSREGWVLPVGESLLGPADLLTAPDKSVSPELEIAGQTYPQPELIDGKPPGAVRVKYPRSPEAIPASRLRTATVPEEVMLVGDPSATTQTVAAARLTQTEGGWTIDPAVPLGAGWHGACVLALSDGAVIGVVKAEERGPAMILPVEAPPR